MEGLPVGDMIKKSDLPLVDAMNSIELFNPKMDTGMTSSSSASSSKISNLGPGSGQRLFDPHAIFRPEEILWIMDEMLAAEASTFPSLLMPKGLMDRWHGTEESISLNQSFAVSTISILNTSITPILPIS
jgi:hypothetical protein